MVSDHWSNGRNIRDLRRVFRGKELAGVSSRSITVTNQSNPLTYTVASSFVCTSPVGATTVVGLSETLTEFRSFLLNVCVLAPESTTNSLSSGFIVDGAGKLHSLVDEKKAALSVSLTFKIHLANLHASPRTSLLSLNLL